MRYPRVFVLCLLIVIWTAANAGAVGRQTVDPNSGGSVAVSAGNQADAGSTWDTDQRLSKPITYSAHRKMLYQILDDLEKQSGVTFFTGRGGTDWRTRELRMNLAVKDLPLTDLMHSIARVTKLKWIRSALDGKAAYRLVGEKVVTEETPEEKAARELAQKRRDFFSQYMDLAHMSTSELDRLQYSNPSLYTLAKTSYGIPVAKLLANMPAASMALMEGRQLLLRGNDLSLSAAGDLLPLVRGAPPGAAVQAPGKPITLPHGMPASTDGLSVEINPSTPGTGAGSSLGEVRISYGNLAVPLAFADPNPASAKATDPAAQPASAAATKVKPAPSPDPIVEHPDEPDLHNKVKLQSKDSRATLDVVQAALAEASGFSVVSDSFAGPSATLDVPQGELELKACLDMIASASGRNWEKRGRIIEMRDRNWIAKRELMIPETTLRKWRNALTSDGKLPDDVLKELRALPVQQFRAYINADNNLAGVAAAVAKLAPPPHP